MSVLFFAAPADGSAPRTLALPAGYRAELWRPGSGGVRPDGMRGAAAGVWWAMHHLRVFSGRDYGQLVVRDAAGTLVHRSGVFPRWLRFPFMRPDDLQVGDTWTHPEHRGRNLAAFAIQEVLARAARPGRTLWYLTEADNVASVRAARKAGLRLVGRGERVSRLGLRALGAFVLTSTAADEATAADEPSPPGGMHVPDREANL